MEGTIPSFKLIIKTISRVEIFGLPFTQRAEVESENGMHTKIFYLFYAMSAPGDYLLTLRFGKDKSNVDQGHTINIITTQNRMILFDPNYGEIAFENSNPSYAACFFATHYFHFGNKYFYISSFKIINLENNRLNHTALGSVIETEV